MKILVTGILGFLGSNLVEELKHHELYGLAKTEDFTGKIKIYSSKDIDKIEIKPDVIIVCHAAVASGMINISNNTLFDINVSLTEQIVKKFDQAFIVYISTCSVYDANENIIEEGSPIKPKSDYALSKLWAERIVLRTQNATVLRISSLYGRNMKENTLIPNYVNAALEKNVIEVWGNGSRLQNYIHVFDVSKCIEKIIQNKANAVNKVLLGVAERQYSNFEVAKKIAQLTDSQIRFINDDLSISSKYMNQYTCSLLNWKPELDLNIELKKYIEWKRQK